jgi:heme/copper-type cytochrome/quinol oxidase subunit 1
MTTIESEPETVADAPSESAEPGDSGSSPLAGVIAVLGSTDHKKIGRLFLYGGLLGLAATVVVNILISIERLDGDEFTLDAEVLPQLLDAQRVGLVFATLLPLAMAACVAFAPLQVGARAIAFPRLALTGFWTWFSGAVLTVISLVNNGGTLGGDGDMVDLYLASIGVMALGLTATAVAVGTSVLTTRAPGMTMRRVPPFTWSALVFAVGVVLVMPVAFGTIVYLFLDHRYTREGFGGNSGIYDWVGWIFTQPTSFLFAIPAIGVLSETVPLLFGRRTPARGVLFSGLALIGVAAFAGVTQQNVQNLPWSGSGLDTDDLGDKANDLGPFLFFNGIPVLGMLIVFLVALQTARPRPGAKVNVTPGLGFAFFGFGMVLVGALGNLLFAIDDLALQNTVFEEATLVYVVYGAVLGVMGAVAHWAPKLWGTVIPLAKLAPLALAGVSATVLACFPLYIAGFLDQPAGLSYENGDLVIWNVLALIGHGLMALTVLGFVVLVVGAARGDDDAGDDPFDGQTIEWTTTSPAPRDNYADVPVVNSAEPLLDLKQASTPTSGSDS